MERFKDRVEAGRLLAKQLKNYTNRSDVIVLALPRGGVPVAYQIAEALAVPLDVFLVRKLGLPGYEELAMGALSDTAIIFNEEVVAGYNISKEEVDVIVQLERQELKRRAQKYRGQRPFPNLKGKTIILVDDGIATGATMQAAVQSLTQQHPASIIVAVPVSAQESLKKISNFADKVICLLKPDFFCAVGEWYANFPQTTDEEVQELLKKNE